MFAPSSIKASLERYWPSATALLWIVAIAISTIVPEVIGGHSVGPFNTLYQSGLTSIPGYHANNFITGDNITQGVPWSAYNWVVVHQGQLPLWNRFNGLGLPQAFNFLSGAFAPTSAVSYLAPLRDAFATLEWAKLVIAGTGVFFLGRVLRLSVVSAAFAATIFELSGAFTGWLAWPQSGSVAWLAWVLGFVILVAENRRGTGAVVLLALVVAANAYEGHPETLALDLICAAIVGVVITLVDVRRAPPVMLAAGRRLGRLALGGAAGLALAAPLLWPGISVLDSGVRHGNVHYGSFAVANLGNILTAGYFGYPIAGSTFFGTNNYYETAMSVGVIAVVLALTALVGQYRLRYVLSFGAIASASLVVLFSQPVAAFLSAHAATDSVQWWHLTFFLTLAIAVLAAMGLDDLVHHWRSPRLLVSLCVATVSVAAGVGLLWIHHWSHHLTPLASSVQRRALVWPTKGIFICGGCALVLIAVSVAARRDPSSRRVQRFASGVALGVVAVLFAAETLTLFTATPRLWSSSTKFFQASPAIQSLQRTVGDERVGLGACAHLNSQPVKFGIRAESNIMYQISEFAAYDPLVPTSLFDAWYRASGTTAPGTFTGSVFCPSITTSEEARHFGVRFVLDRTTAPIPAGLKFVRDVGDEQLDMAPGAGVATIETAGDDPDSPSARALPVRWTTNSSMRITTTAVRPSVLSIHEQAARGWHVAIDGHSTPFRIYDDTMMLVAVSPGHHVVTLTYRPASFVKGIAVSSLTLVALTSLLVIDRVWRRRRLRWIVTAEDASCETS